MLYRRLLSHATNSFFNRFDGRMCSRHGLVFALLSSMYLCKALIQQAIPTNSHSFINFIFPVMFNDTILYYIISYHTISCHTKGFQEQRYGIIGSQSSSCGQWFGSGEHNWRKGIAHCTKHCLIYLFQWTTYRQMAVDAIDAAIESGGIVLYSMWCTYCPNRHR